MFSLSSRLKKRLARLHGDERGGVTIETVLIIAAIALPILIFILKVGWPMARNFFLQGMNDLQNEANNVPN